MNVTMRLTFDGMVRALRWRAHALAEGEGGMYADPGREDRMWRESRPLPKRREEDDDDRAGE